MTNDELDKIASALHDVPCSCEDSGDQWHSEAERLIDELEARGFKIVTAEHDRQERENARPSRDSIAQALHNAEFDIEPVALSAHAERFYRAADAVLALMSEPNVVEPAAWFDPQPWIDGHDRRHATNGSDEHFIGNDFARWGCSQCIRRHEPRTEPSRAVTERSE